MTLKFGLPKPRKLAGWFIKSVSLHWLKPRIRQGRQPPPFLIALQSVAAPQILSTTLLLFCVDASPCLPPGRLRRCFNPALTGAGAFFQGPSFKTLFWIGCCGFTNLCMMFFSFGWRAWSSDQPCSLLFRFHAKLQVPGHKDNTAMQMQGLLLSAYSK